MSAIEPSFAMFIVFGELVLCGFVIFGAALLSGAHPKVALGVFLAYVAFVLANYFVVRWKHEGLKKKVTKFTKLRKKVSNFEFGLPGPPEKPKSRGAAPTKPK